MSAGDGGRGVGRDVVDVSTTRDIDTCVVEVRRNQRRAKVEVKEALHVRELLLLLLAKAPLLLLTS